MVTPRGAALRQWEHGRRSQAVCNSRSSPFGAMTKAVPRIIGWERSPHGSLSVCSHHKTVRQFEETGRGCSGDSEGRCRSGGKLASRTLLILVQLDPGSTTGHLKPKFLRNLALLKHNKTKGNRAKSST